MTPAQRAAAERLADWLEACGVVNAEVRATAALLRELAAEPQGENDAMTFRNNTVIDCTVKGNIMFTTSHPDGLPLATEPKETP